MKASLESSEALMNIYVSGALSRFDPSLPCRQKPKWRKPVFRRWRSTYWRLREQRSWQLARQKMKRRLQSCRPVSYSPNCSSKMQTCFAPLANPCVRMVQQFNVFSPCSPQVCTTYKPTAFESWIVKISCCASFL